MFSIFGFGNGIVTSLVLFVMWMLFGGYCEERIRNTSLLVFGAYLLVGFLLYYLRSNRVATFLAWLPPVVIFVIWPLARSIPDLFIN